MELLFKTYDCNVKVSKHSVRDSGISVCGLLKEVTKAFVKFLLIISVLDAESCQVIHSTKNQNLPLSASVLNINCQIPSDRFILKTFLEGFDHFGMCFLKNGDVMRRFIITFQSLSCIDKLSYQEIFFVVKRPGLFFGSSHWSSLDFGLNYPERRSANVKNTKWVFISERIPL